MSSLEIIKALYDKGISMKGLGDSDASKEWNTYTGDTLIAVSLELANRHISDILNEVENLNNGR